MSMVVLLSALIGLPLAAISVILVLKYRDRIQLTYIDQGCLPLFESIVKSIEGIEILYKKKAIDPSLHLLTGSFANTGNLDIDRSAIYDPLSINLPSTYKWLQARITKSPSGVNANYEIKSGSTLEFRWDLLKTNEAFSFNALIKAPKAKIKSIMKLMSFSHRITNLQRITKETLSGPVRRLRMQRFRLRFPTLMLAAGVFFLVTFGYFLPIKRIHHLLERPSSGKTLQALIRPGRDNLLRIKVRDDGLSEQIKTEDFSSKYKISGLILEDQLDLLIYMVVLLYFLPGGGLFCWTYYRRRRLRKLRRIMKT